MTKEPIVRDIVGYEGLYSIDIFGNVIRLKDQKEMSTQTNAQGYINVSLSKDKKQTQHKLHRLVAQAFIPNPLNKEQVNHIDGDKTNNAVWNLEWTNCKDNINHAVKTGKVKRLVPIKVVETGKIYSSISECARDIGGMYQCIWHCLNGDIKTYKGYHFEKVLKQE